jgi:arylsulfatase A-like enzyme
VLIVITDDQRWDSMEAMPAVRRWFGEGGRTFPNAFATTPLCCPSRATIMTGRYAHNHGVLTNHHTERLDHGITLQRELRAAGYLTAIAGKFLNEWDIGEPPPHFDRYAIDSPFLTGNGYVGDRFNVDGELREVGYATRFIERTALRYIHSFESQDRRPWLLYVTPFAPHAPAIPEAEYRSAPVSRWRPNPAVLERDLGDKPPFLAEVESLPLGELERFRDLQLRTLRSVDDLVNSLMSELEELGERNTLAFFTSDNGLLHGEHGPFEKRLPYDPSILVPLMVRWPGHVASDTRDGRLAANVDLFPTVMEAAGLEARGTIEGRSLLTSPPRDMIFLERFRDVELVGVPSWASVRTLTAQYIEWYRGGRTLFSEYYDLEADPWQLRNLVVAGEPSDREEIQAMRGLVARLRSCVGTTGPNACP